MDHSGTCGKSWTISSSSWVPDMGAMYYIHAEGASTDEMTTFKVMRSMTEAGKSGYARTDRDVVVDRLEVKRTAAVEALRELHARVDAMNV